ncbi:MAG: hypothetical protein H0T44_09030 [Gemmatimonadales bacterium]|nr:hypothetical protein [Gemmatimonadales bacterium]
MNPESERPGHNGDDALEVGKDRLADAERAADEGVIEAEHLQERGEELHEELERLRREARQLEGGGSS